MVIKSVKGYFEILKNAKDAFNLEQFEAAYIEEWYDKYDYICGDISDQKLRLKGFTKDKDMANGYDKIIEYVLESACYQPAYYILKKVDSTYFEAHKEDKLSQSALEFEDRSFHLEKVPYDKENISLEKTKKNSPNIKIDPYKMNVVKTYPLPDDLAQEIARDRAFEQRANSGRRNNRSNNNNNKNRNQNNKKMR